MGSVPRHESTLVERAKPREAGTGHRTDIADSASSRIASLTPTICSKTKTPTPVKAIEAARAEKSRPSTRVKRRTGRTSPTPSSRAAATCWTTSSGA